MSAFVRSFLSQNVASAPDTLITNFVNKNTNFHRFLISLYIDSLGVNANRNDDNILREFETYLNFDVLSEPNTSKTDSKSDMNVEMNVKVNPMARVTSSNSNHSFILFRMPIDVYSYTLQFCNRFTAQSVLKRVCRALNLRQSRLNTYHSIRTLTMSPLRMSEIPKSSWFRSLSSLRQLMIVGGLNEDLYSSFVKYFKFIPDCCPRLESIVLMPFSEDVNIDWNGLNGFMWKPETETDNNKTQQNESERNESFDYSIPPYMLAIEEDEQRIEMRHALFDVNWLKYIVSCVHLKSIHSSYFTSFVNVALFLKTRELFFKNKNERNDKIQYFEVFGAFDYVIECRKARRYLARYDHISESQNVGFTFLTNFKNKLKVISRLIQSASGNNQNYLNSILKSTDIKRTLIQFYQNYYYHSSNPSNPEFQYETPISDALLQKSIAFYTEMQKTTANIFESGMRFNSSSHQCMLPFGITHCIIPAYIDESFLFANSHKITRLVKLVYIGSHDWDCRISMNVLDLLSKFTPNLQEFHVRVHKSHNDRCVDFKDKSSIASVSQTFVSLLIQCSQLKRFSLSFWREWDQTNVQIFLQKIKTCMFITKPEWNQKPWFDLSMVEGRSYLRWVRKGVRPIGRL